MVYTFKMLSQNMIWIVPADPHHKQTTTENNGLFSMSESWANNERFFFQNSIK